MIANYCPRCGTPLTIPMVRNSRSRLDNKTYICNPCGGAEAAFDYLWPDDDLPPLNQKIQPFARTGIPRDEE